MLAEALRFNTTVMSLNLGSNGLGEGGGRTIQAETLRLDATLTSLDLRGNRPGEGGGLALAQTMRLRIDL
jgi:hypothetical protein